MTESASAGASRPRTSRPRRSPPWSSWCTCSPSRRPRRSGTRPSTSPRPRCSASPSAGQSALHPHGARLGPAAPGRSPTRSGSTCSRPSPAPSPPASGSWSPSAGCSRWCRCAGHGSAAAAGVLVGAFSWTVWNQSTVNEKVYTVSLLSVALVMWLVVHWADDEPGPHRDRWLVLIAYVLALTSTNHMMGVLATPAVVIYVLWTDWRVFTRPWVIAGVIVAVHRRRLAQLHLPADARGPVPRHQRRGADRLLQQGTSDVLNRAQYGKPPVFVRQADFLAQISNYLQYFSWQFAPGLDAHPDRRGIALRRARTVRPGGALAPRPPRRPGRGGDARDAHHRARDLPQLQVRVLATSRDPAGPP